VLIVDDEPALANLLSMSLSSRGLRTRCCLSATEALPLLLANPTDYDVVITDQTMPGMPGSELFLRVREANLSIPMIVCTGHSDILNEETATRMGFSAYLPKPVSLGALFEAVVSALENRK
jgi:DNA-binding NtrC family response regulator